MLKWKWLIKNIILWKMVSYSSLAFAFGNHPVLSEPTTKPTFVRDTLDEIIVSSHKQALNYLEAGNLTFLAAVENCYCLIKKSCPSNYQTKAENFAHLLIINSGGDYQKISYTCEQIVNLKLGKGLDQSKTEIKVSLALSKAEIPSPVPGFILRGFNGKRRFTGLANLSPQHEFKMPDMPHSISPLNSQEVQMVIDELLFLKAKTCMSYLESLDYLTFSSLSIDNACTTLESVLKTKAYKDRYYSYVKERNNQSVDSYFTEAWLQFRNDKRNLYVKALMENRFALILPDRPTNEDILESFALFKKKAQERYTKNNFENFDINGVYDSRWAMSSTMSIIRKERGIVKDSESEKYYLNAIGKIMSAIHTERERNQLYTDIGLTALALGCFVVPEVKLPAMIFGSSLCAGVAFTSLDIYFLISSAMTYYSESDKYLSTIMKEFSHHPYLRARYITDPEKPNESDQITLLEEAGDNLMTTAFLSAVFAPLNIPLFKQAFPAKQH